MILFLLGYFVFSHDKVQEELEKHNIVLLIAAIVLFVIEIQKFWRKSFADLKVINNYLVFLYGWIMMLAVIANFKGRTSTPPMKLRNIYELLKKSNTFRIVKGEPYHK
ncbi:hypothetical protein [Clostridium lundense]|uniref:hypothetical protein n=1 Tax=Clostridium lundense TaxID=319475 RepID=UPI0012EB20DB|nr:hypothetical protein [Clostridium lundense]